MNSKKEIRTDIKDVCAICIIDSSENILYSLNFSDVNLQHLAIFLKEDVTATICVYQDKTLFLERMNDIAVVLIGAKDSNELFLKRAFDCYLASLSKIIKNWSIERIQEKYDQIILLSHEFVFDGIILVDESEDLSKNTMKRTFENLNVTKVNKGFASFLNKATKSFRK